MHVHCCLQGLGMGGGAESDVTNPHLRENLRQLLLLPFHILSLLLLTRLQRLKYFLEADAFTAWCCSQKLLSAPILLVIKWSVCSLFSMLAGSMA